MDTNEHKRQIGKVECSTCGRAWIGHSDSSCPFCHVERLQAIIKERETAVACLRGLEKAGGDMCDDLRREWEKSEAEIKRLQALAGRAVLAYHLVSHAGVGSGKLYAECEKPFCTEARALGLPVEVTERRRESDET